MFYVKLSKCKQSSSSETKTRRRWFGKRVGKCLAKCLFADARTERTYLLWELKWDLRASLCLASVSRLREGASTLTQTHSLFAAVYPHTPLYPSSSARRFILSCNNIRVCFLSLQFVRRKQRRLHHARGNDDGDHGHLRLDGRVALRARHYARRGVQRTRG